MFLAFTPQAWSAPEDRATPKKSQSAEKLRKAPKADPAREHAKTFTEPVTGMTFVFVRGGCYQMGDTFGKGDANEKPVHKVCVDDLYMAKYEVTQKEWQAVMGSNPSHFDDNENNPVESVSWNDANDFISRLAVKTGKKFRLPTEAEWEYAARSGGKKEKYAGFSADSQIYLYGNFCDDNCELKTKTWRQDDGYQTASPVGNYRPNGLGLYDMTGNVWEWCADWFRNDYYRSSPIQNPPGPDKDTSRVLRGGSWGSIPAYVRATNRGYSTPEYRDSYIGFRLVLPLK